MTKPSLLRLLGLLLSEKQIPQVVENLENGDEPKEALERAVMRPRQVRYRAALRPDSLTILPLTFVEPPRAGQNSTFPGD